MPEPLLEIGPPGRAAADALGVPGGFADEAFPIATSPFFQCEGSEEWWYELNLRKAGCPVGEETAEVEGTVSGREVYWAGGRRAGTPDGDHPITSGTFKAGAEFNSIELVIDRTSSGGSAEPYAGGWAALDAAVRPGASAGSTVVEPVRLLLTSKTTGLQFAILHQASARRCR